MKMESNFFIEVEVDPSSKTMKKREKKILLSYKSLSEKDAPGSWSLTFINRITSSETRSKIILSILICISLVQCTPSKNTHLKAVFSLLTSNAISNSGSLNNTQYSLGGTVTNLIGTGLTLQNNSKDNLSISADSNFTFATSLADNTSYSVSILQQPSNQSCTVANASGTIKAANINNITITCSNTGNANGSLSNGTILNALILTGGVTTFAGSPCTPNTSCAAGGNGYVDSTDPTLVRFKNPEGIITDGVNFYIADKSNDVIRKIVISTGATTTFAGNGTAALVDGTGTTASFEKPNSLTTDGANIYVADKNNKAIRKIVIATGVVTTLVSNDNNFQDPKGMVVLNNNLYIADNTGNAIRQIDLTTNTVTTVLNTGLNSPTGMTLVGTDIYLADKSSDRILKIPTTTWVSSVFAGSSSGYIDAVGVAAKFNNPENIVTDGTNLYVCESGNDIVRKIVISTATVSTLSGTGTAAYTNSSTSTLAEFKNAKGIVSDGVNLYVVDSGNHTIRKIN